MRNASLAVVRTIPQRLISGWMPPLITLGWCVMGLNSLLVQRAIAPRFNYCLLGGTIFVVGLLAFHLKQIVQDAKGRLLPGAPRRPLLVAAILVGLYLIGMPLLIHAYWPAPLVSQAAVTWLVAASTLFFVVRQSWLSVALPMLAFIGGFTADSTLQLHIAALVEMPLIAWYLLAISGVWLYHCGRCLSQMTEESSGYQPIGRRPTNWYAAPGSTSEAGEIWRDPSKAKWLAYGAPWARQIDNALRPEASATLWSRCRRWRAVQQGSIVVWTMLAVVSGMQIFVFRSLSYRPNSTTWLSGPIAMLLVMVPMFSTASSISNWRYRTTDLLKPQRREDFIREMGLCLAIDLFRNLAIAGMILGVMVAILAPAVLSQIQPESIVRAGLFAVGAVALWYGALVWFLRYRLGMAIGLIVPGFVVAVAMLIAHKPLDTLTVAVAAGVMMIIGIVLTADAYRRWLITDLG